MCVCLHQDCEGKRLDSRGRPIESMSPRGRLNSLPNAKGMIGLVKMSLALCYIQWRNWVFILGGQRGGQTFIWGAKRTASQ